MSARLSNFWLIENTSKTRDILPRFSSRLPAFPPRARAFLHIRAHFCARAAIPRVPRATPTQFLTFVRGHNSPANGVHAEFAEIGGRIHSAT